MCDKQLKEQQQAKRITDLFCNTLMQARPANTPANKPYDPYHAFLETAKPLFYHIALTTKSLQTIENLDQYAALPGFGAAVILLSQAEQTKNEHHHNASFFSHKTSLNATEQQAAYAPV
jgi:hypothetical protein